MTENGAAKPGISVNITVASGASFSGTTDAAGQFGFNYVPPSVKRIDQISATCTGCSNTASQTITVDTAEAPICKANPVDIGSGTKLEFASDWQDSGAHPLSITRAYSSAGIASATLGDYWSHNFSAALTPVLGNSGLQSRAVRLGNGASIAFTRANATSAWVSDNGKDQLIESAQGDTFFRASDETQWLFAPFTHRLLSITQRNGWAMQLGYNAAAQLITVTNTFGRVLNFAYNAQGDVSSITTPDAKTISYGYDSQQRLTGVLNSDTTQRSYLYEDTRFPNALTGQVNEAGVRFGTYAYDAQGRTSGSSHIGGVQNYSFSYPTGGAGSAVGQLVAAGPVNPALYVGTTQLQDPLGNLATYTFQGGNGTLRLLSSTAPYGDGEVANRSFLPTVNLPTSETDFLGTQTLFTWDINRQLLLSTTKAANKPEAQATSTQWHPTWRLPVLMTELGRTTAYTYDARGNRLTEVITDTVRNQSRTQSWTYTAQNLIATSTDPRGQVSQYTYDIAGNLVSMRNALNQLTSFAYDGAGRMLTQTEANGLVTSYTYDLRGRMRTTTRGTGAGSEVTTMIYTPSGQLATLTLPNGYAASYTYDAAQRLIALADNRGASASYVLDNMGNRVREEIKDASGTVAQLSTRSINALNRVATVSGAAGQTTALGYDANGEPVSQTDPLAQTTRQTLDGLRRVRSTTLADNAVATQVWNALDQLTQAIDPKQVATSYTYNAFGEVLSETSPDSGIQTYTRDAAGNVTSSTDARGQVTQTSRDALGRPTLITLADGKTHALSYDTVGNVSQMLDASGSTSYTRDVLSRILQKTQTVADNPTNPSSYGVQYVYHPGGGVAQINYPSGLKVYYRKSAAGQISQIDVQEPGGTASKPKPLIPFVAGLAYTALNQPKAWSWNCNAGITAAPAPIPCGSASRSFDADGRMTANEFASYGYDSASRITSITQNLWASLDGINNSVTPITWSAGYDSRNRLTSFNRTGNSTVNSTGNSTTTSYSYDANSNRLTSINKTTSDTDQDGDFDAIDFQKTTSQALAVDATSNKLTGFTQTLATQRTNAAGNPVTSTVNSQVNYSLDANGNLTSDGLRTFEYDTANRLSKVQVSQSAEASKITYLHNALGQRVFKSEPQVAQTAPSQTELGVDFITWLKSNFGWLFAQAQANATLGQSYVYDDANLGSTPNLLGEYGNGGTKSAGRIEYIWLPTEDGTSIPIGIYKGGRFLAVHSDHLGTPRLIVDDTSKPVWQWPYSAFGDNKPTGVLKATPNPKAAITNQPVLLKATAATEINLRFPGQYFDEESNLNYNYFRSYQASQGRYTQSDPIGLGGGLNRYQYAESNPLSFSDPEGLNPAIALGQAGRAGWNIGQAINPYVQPMIAAGLDGLLLPSDTSSEGAMTVQYPERKRGKFTCICRANKDGRSPDNCSIDGQNFAMGYGEGATLTEAKRAAEKSAKEKLGARSTHHVQCRCRDPKGDPIIPTR